MLAYSNWKPVLVGTEVVTGISLDGIETRLLYGSTQTLSAKAYRKFLCEVNLAPREATRRLENENAQLIHVHFGTDAVQYWPVIRRLNVPVVVTLHGYDINIYKDAWSGRFFGAGRYPARLLSLAQQPGVHFVAVSEAIKQRAIEYGIPAERVSVRYIGIDTSRFKFSDRPLCERRRRVLFVGRFVEKKGCEYLIKAYARVKSAIPDAELIMVGDGPLKAELVRLADELNVHVEFTGSLSSAGVKEQMDKARVFCLPSITAHNGDAEGFGMALLEAQASGVPVVTSAKGGAAEGILDGVTGFAFPERDTDSLCKRLSELLRNDQLASSMSYVAPKWIAQKFDIRRCTRELEALYEDLSLQGLQASHVH